MNYTDYLKSIGACQEAIEDAQSKTAQQVWDACRKGNWMLWLIQETMKDNEQEQRKLTLAKARCAKLVIHLMRDKRSIKAIEVAEKFGMNQATREELNAAAEAAAAAAAYARKKILKQCTDIVRELYPVSPAVEIIGEDKCPNGLNTCKEGNI